MQVFFSYVFWYSFIDDNHNPHSPVFFYILSKSKRIHIVICPSSFFLFNERWWSITFYLLLYLTFWIIDKKKEFISFSTQKNKFFVSRLNVQKMIWSTWICIPLIIYHFHLHIITNCSMNTFSLHGRLIFFSL